jgi:hypothetical protein
MNYVDWFASNGVKINNRQLALWIARVLYTKGVMLPCKNHTGRWRIPGKDYRNYELTFDSAEEMVKIAAIRLLLNKI